MFDFSLIPTPFLGNYAAEFAGTRLVEVTDSALVSVAIPLGGEAALAAALHASFGAEPPAVGRSTRSADGAVRFLGLSADQFFAFVPGSGGPALPFVAERLGGVGYLTEQTDAWVVIALEGPAALAALERLCPLDLDPDAFPEGRVARTVMEHLGVILLREGPDRFLLMSASSSARCFQRALEEAVRHVT